MCMIGRLHNVIPIMPWLGVTVFRSVGFERMCATVLAWTDRKKGVAGSLIREESNPARVKKDALARQRHDNSYLVVSRRGDSSLSVSLRGDSSLSVSLRGDLLSLRLPQRRLLSLRLPQWRLLSLRLPQRRLSLSL